MIQSVVIAGAGTMGSGIAQVFAQNEIRVSLVDVDESQLENAKKKIRASLEKFAAKKIIENDQVENILSHINFCSELNINPQSDLFIEAVYENPKLKADVLQAADRVFSPQTLFSSNTSGLSISQMGSKLRKGRDFIGLHFFNPVPIMKLLEVVVGNTTSPKAVQTAKWIAQKIAKEAIVVQDSPGFATSRLGVCLAFEAIRMLEAKVASAEDIDKAMVLGYGHPMGPLKLTDLVGLDVRLAIGQHLFETLGFVHFEPPKLLHELVAHGNLGQKTGRGFYSW